MFGWRIVFIALRTARARDPPHHIDARRYAEADSGAVCFGVIFLCEKYVKKQAVAALYNAILLTFYCI